MPTANAAAVRLTEVAALRDVKTLLTLCWDAKLLCSPTTRRPSAAAVRVVADALVDGDFYRDEAIAAFAWPLLVQAGGLARLDGSRLTLTPQGRRAIDAPAHDVISDLWKRWIIKAPIDEFSRVDPIKGQRAAGVLTAAGPRRRVVADALSLCASGEWIAVDDLFRTMRRRRLNPTIARSERATFKLYLEHPEYGSLGYADCHDWPILEGRYTLAVLFEYAATLGLLDVEYVRPEGARDDYHQQWSGDDLDALSRYDGLLAVRLTDLGRYASGLLDTYVLAPAPAPDRALRVLANHDVVATGAVSGPDRQVLDAFATGSSDRVWTFSLTTLLRAIDAGRTPQEFADFLAARIVDELPPTVTRLFADAAESSRQLRDLGLYRVFQCGDAHVATLLERDRTLRGRCTRVGELLLVRQDDEPKVRAAMLRLGYAAAPGDL